MNSGHNHVKIYIENLLDNFTIMSIVYVYIKYITINSVVIT